MHVLKNVVDDVQVCNIRTGLICGAGLLNGVNARALRQESGGQIRDAPRFRTSCTEGVDGSADVGTKNGRRQGWGLPRTNVATEFWHGRIYGCRVRSCYLRSLFLSSCLAVDSEKWRNVKGNSLAGSTMQPTFVPKSSPDNPECACIQVEKLTHAL